MKTMLTIYNAMKDADVIVFTSPIFFDHITAQAKTFIDRLYSLYSMRTLETGKKAVVTINYEWNKPDVYMEWWSGSRRGSAATLESRLSPLSRYKIQLKGR